MNIEETPTSKSVTSKDYNHFFCKLTGFSKRWGETVKDDPQWSPYGPELLDIEISSVVSESDAQNLCANPNLHITDGGCNGVGCGFCYKKNHQGNKNINMTVGMFEEILDKMPKTICQIALGITSIDANPDLWNIMSVCRSRGIIPNITINGIGITDHHIEMLMSLCGAVAVSANETNIGIVTPVIRKLLAAGMKQTNIHYVLHEDSLQFLLKSMENQEEILKEVNAVVLLTAKDKAGVGIKPCNLEDYKTVIAAARSNNVRLGFDSCAACMYENALKDDPDFDKIVLYSERCESMLFSAYINVEGVCWACSFAEGLSHKWNLSDCESFLSDVWYSKEAKEWRQRLMDTERNCPIYNI